MEKLNIPVIEGTTRPQRQSIKVSKFIVEVAKQIEEVDAFLVDPVEFNFPGDGNDPEGKDPSYTELTKNADAFFIVIPEYNHGYPGSLKRMLDSELSNYIHKPVAFAGVSSGPWGGVRAIESLLHPIREMGMVATFTDVQFPKVQELFKEDGWIKDDAYVDRVKKAFTELAWMAKAMKWARINLPSKYHQNGQETTNL